MSNFPVVETSLNVPLQWMDKQDVVYIHNGILLRHEKEGNNVICSDTDGPRDYQAKWSQTEKDKYHMILLACGIWKKKI